MGFIETAYSGNPTLKDLDINSDLDLKGVYNAIGIKRFMCEDYLGAIQTTASDNLKWTLNLGSLSNAAESTKQFRIPSNFVSSTLKFGFQAKNTANTAIDITLEKFDPNTETYSTVYTKTLAANSGTTELTTTDITVNAGELYRFSKTAGTFSSASTKNTKVLCDVLPYSGAVWEIITP